MPDGARRVVVNTTPIITLSLIQQLPLLRDLYGDVFIPTAVQRELLAGGPGRPGAELLQRATWIHPRDLASPERADLLIDLDRGEAEVIALAQELSCDLVVLDERLARRRARLLGLPLTGTLGVLLKAKERGLVPGIAPLIAAIRSRGIWLAEPLVQRVLEMAGE